MPPDLAEPPRFIVGIGASAGGLEALERFFKNMPSDSGMAFVVIQHLSPDFKSLMDELLARFTTMGIHRVSEPVEMRSNTIYLLPSRKEMVMEGGTLRVQDKSDQQSLHLPINTFFRTLAREQTDKAIAIVLSGTGTDGTLGLLDVHDLGGLVLARAARPPSSTACPAAPSPRASPTPSSPRKTCRAS
jgi:two-component system, chemotaxis family, CheB/CheR fusion protein